MSVLVVVGEENSSRIFSPQKGGGDRGQEPTVREVHGRGEQLFASQTCDI